MDPSEEPPQELSDDSVHNSHGAEDSAEPLEAPRDDEAIRSQESNGLFIAALTMVTIFLVALVFLTGDDEPEADEFAEARQMLERAEERAARQASPPQIQQRQQFQQRQQPQTMPSGERRFEQIQAEHIHRQASRQMESQSLDDQPMMRITEEGRQYLESMEMDGFEGLQGFQGMEGPPGESTP